MKRIEDIKEFEDIDTYYGISSMVEEIFEDRVEAHKHLVTANKEIERLREENLLLRASEPMSKLQEDYGYKAKVERLNNIINELENWLERIESFASIVCVKDIKEKIKKLKGEDKE